MLFSVSLPRLAALALTVLLAPSCLVTSVDSFPDPPKTPPFLNGSLASPPISQIVLVNSPTTSDPITFSSYVRSEDAGAELQVNLVADWPNGATIGSTRIGAGSFSEQRLLSFAWDPKIDPLSGSISEGCHSFTLIVTHTFNFHSNIPAFPADSDSLVWWVFVGKPGGLNDFDLSRCVTSTQLPAPTPTSTSTTTTNAPVSP